MKRLAFQLAIVTVFSLALAHFAYRAWGPPSTPKYYVENHGTALMGPESDGDRGKFLYVRRTLNLPQQPRHAWLQVIGRDRIAVYVNGERLGIDGPIHKWSSPALMLDITPYLKSGENCIAVSANQITPLRPPLISIEGGYVLEGHEYRFRGDETWRANHFFERGKSWWFSEEFDDRRWPFAKVVDAPMRGQVYVPPRAIATPRAAYWLSPPTLEHNVASFRREFEVEGRPRSAWLRLTATTSYRLAVNGVYVDEQEKQMSVTRIGTPMQRLYDITPAMQPGSNSVAIQLTSNGELPHALADLEVTDEAGEVYSLGSDKNWLACGTLTSDWSSPQVEPGKLWAEPIVESGDMGLNSVMFPRETVIIEWPERFTNDQLLWEFALAVFIGVVGFLLCWLVDQWFVSRRVGAGEFLPASVAFLALVPATVAMLAGMVALYDPRFAQQDLYRPAASLAAILSVPLQWLALVVIAPLVAGKSFSPGISLPRIKGLSAPAWILILLILIGGWLRIRNIAVEPIHHDEVSAYWFTRGVLEAGFPGGQVSEDTPYGYAATSELAYFPTAVIAVFTDDPIYVLRIPSVLWSVATIWLVYFVGKRMFSSWVGLVGAALYTFSPYCIEMSNFGRYFAQLQFFTLLCVYYFYRTIRGTGPIDTKALWLTAASFLAMYLTWEGSGFLSLGMIGAALVQRRTRMRTVLLNPQVWATMLLMIVVFLLQDSHRIIQQTQRLWYGIGISDLELMPMWRYNNFLPSFYVVQLSWCSDSLLPLALVFAAGMLALRHPWQEPLRVMLISVLGTAVLMTALLPLRAARYDYHLLPLAILPSAAALVTLARGFLQLVGTLRVPLWARAYASAVGVFTVAVVVALASGMTVQLTEMYRYNTLAYRVGELKFPHWEEPLRYLREHLREGDIVIATFPHVVDHTMYFAKDNPVKRGWTSDYWLQSTLVLQATLDDRRPMPLDRRAGTVMIPSLESLEDVFARHGRIWFLVSSGANNGLNDRAVSEFVRQHMEVVYEDFLATVMVRDGNHRPAALRGRDDFDLRSGKANFLP